MADADVADADKERSPDTTPASDEAKGDSGPAAAETTPTGGVGDMALQKKAEVGAADDPAEKEADSVAQRIMRATEAPKPVEGGGLAEPVPVPKPGGEGAEPIRRKTVPGTDPAGPEGGELPDSVRSYLAGSKGGGSPLPEATRTFFESRFDGAGFGAVRVHDDPGANEAARLIGAVAFTRGSDVYFAAGMYDPVSEAGRGILAHELTHVVQQGGAGKAPSPTAVGAAGGAGGTHEGGAGDGGVGDEAGVEGAVTPDTPNVVRRKGNKNEAAGEKSSKADVKSGSIDLNETKLHIKELEMPTYKKRLSGDPVTIRGKGERPNDQIKVWEDNVAGDVKTNVEQRIAALTSGKKLVHNRGPIYYLRHGDKSTRYLIGDLDAIAAAVRRPRWDQEGKPARFDVDHMKEWQLSGDHVISNMWLLFFSDNRSAGSTIKSNINRGIQSVIDEARPKLDKRPPSAKTIKSNWTVTATPKGKGGQANPRHWKVEDMKKKVLTEPLQLVPEKKVKELKGAKDAVAIYSRGFGGALKVVDPENLDWGKEKSFRVSKVDAKEGGGGSVSGRFYVGNERVEPGSFTAALKPIPGVEYGGYLDAGYAARGLMFKGLSPLVFEDAEFDPDKGLIATAKIPTPSLSILKNTEIGVRFDGPDVEAYAVVTVDGISLPGPLQVTGGALELSVGTKGFNVKGEMALEIEKLGRGKLKAAAGSAGAFGLSAELEVDSELFTEAKAKVEYIDGKWSGGGTLGVGEGKVKGVKTASVTVEISEEKITAKGRFETSIKGVEKGTLDVNYEKGKGLEVSGQLTLGKLPGIEGGTIDAKVKEGADGYTVSGGVTAKPSIPGVTGSVTGKYEDGAFLAEADLGYAKGMLSGRVHLGVTNQAVSAGKPGGPPTNQLTTWGGGQVTIKIAPWLQGAVGLELDPTGKLTVMGEVGLPNELTFFDEKKIEKKIFSIGIDIPIVGVSVLGQRIGIFATIRGGLDASAGFGPGTLRALSLRVNYSPDDEAATQVTGKAEVHVPAHAGLKLYVQGGVGAGIPVVSATVGIEVSGALGLEGAAKAGVEVNWTPAKGLVIDAKGEIFVEPKFKFSIDGFVDVHADLLFDTIDLYKKKWNFAAFEYGSNLRFGVKFPVKYEEGKPFELSLSNVEFVYPSIDATALMKGLITQIA